MTYDRCNFWNIHHPMAKLSSSSHLKNLYSWMFGSRASFCCKLFGINCLSCYIASISGIFCHQNRRCILIGTRYEPSKNSFITFMAMVYDHSHTSTTQIPGTLLVDYKVDNYCTWLPKSGSSTNPLHPLNVLGANQKAHTSGLNSSPMPVTWIMLIHNHCLKTVI